MAWLEKDRPNGPYQLVVRVGSRRLKRSTRTTDERAAQEFVLRVDRRLALIETGELDVPEDVDVLTFAMSDGPVARKQPVPLSVSLKQAFDEYLDSLPDGALEENTLVTVRIHIKHLMRVIGASCRIRDINRQTLQSYINARTKENGRNGKKVSATTIKKELTTFGTVWRFAVDAGYAATPLPKRDLKYPKSEERPRFQTWPEIEARIAAGGLSEVEQKELWGTLFLTLEEIEQLLAFVKQHAVRDFVYPMVVMAAHTGARRSELVRSLRSDVDFRANMITLRERKRVRGQNSTRIVPMSPLLRQALEEWFRSEPNGKFTFGITESISRCRAKAEGPTPLTVDQAHDHLQRTLTGKWSRVRGWHVLRHSFASNCAAKAVDQRTINAWMGHQTEEMVRRYRHLIPDLQQRAIQSVFGHTPSAA